MASAMVEEPASQSKLDLIRKFLVASGIQLKIDSGSFLERYSCPGGPLFNIPSASGEELAFKEAFERPIRAVKAAYEQYRTGLARRV